MTTNSSSRLTVRLLGVVVRVESTVPELLDAIGDIYGAALCEDEHPRLSYEVGSSGLGYFVRRESRSVDDISCMSDFLWEFDRDLIIEIQKQRQYLYFAHAAVIEWRGVAAVIAAPSGVGKSTTAWAMVHHGARYLSDELAPIEPSSLVVSPFPRALCLKNEAPLRYPTPADARRADRILYIRPSRMPTRPCTNPVRIGALFFLQRASRLSTARASQLTPGEGTARLYTCTLNALAHESDGLSAASRIASSVPCYELAAADVTDTAVAVIETVDDVVLRVGVPSPTPSATQGAKRPG